MRLTRQFWFTVLFCQLLLFSVDAVAFGPGAMTRLGDLIGAIVWGTIGAIAAITISLILRYRTWKQILMATLIGGTSGVILAPLF